MPNQPRIYMLHRVLKSYDPNNYYFQRNTAISWKRFLNLLDEIQKNDWITRPISYISSGYSSKDIFITFDDGYSDNRDAIDEILRRGMVATIYPAMDFVKNRFSPIDDMAHHLMAEPVISKEISESLLNGRLKKILRAISAPRYRYLRNKWFGIKLDAINPSLFMTEELLIHYSKSGVELGIHGISHRVFTQLPKSTLINEITDSVNWILNLTNISPKSICFPHGKHDIGVVALSLKHTNLLLGVEGGSFCTPVLPRIHIKEHENVRI